MKHVRGAATAVFLAGLVSAAHANSIASVVVDANGRVYFSDYIRNRIWRLDPGGQPVPCVVGKHTHHLVLDGRNSLYGEHVPSGGGAPALWRVEPDGSAAELFPATRHGQALNYEGTVFAIDEQGNLDFLRDCQIVRLAADGRIEPWAGRRCAGMVWRSDALRYGHLHGSLIRGPHGAFFFSDARTVRRVAPDGSVWTLTGRPATLFAPPQPGEAVFDRVMGLALSDRGELFVADRGRRAIFRLDGGSNLERVAGVGFFNTPIGLGFGNGRLYVLTQLRMPTPGFLAGLVGNPTLLRVEPDGKLVRLASVGTRSAR